MQLFWNTRSFPRTMTRQEWRIADRWRRVTQKRLAEEDERLRAAAARVPEEHPELKARLLDRLVNPPILMNPWAEKSDVRL